MAYGYIYERKWEGLLGGASYNRCVELAPQLETSCSLRVCHRPAAVASPGNLLEVLAEPESVFQEDARSESTFTFGKC